MLRLRSRASYPTATDPGEKPAMDIALPAPPNASRCVNESGATSGVHGER